MGTDIHGVWQIKTPEGWQDTAHPLGWDQERNYQLFAVLAGVRNGRGFAGVLLGEAVTPIAEPRGFPEGFEVNEDQRHPTFPDALHPQEKEWYLTDPAKERKPCTMWMGCHDQSWLTVDEMLAWYASAPVVRRCGVISVEEYRAWDREGEPHSYCGDVSGRDVVTCEETHLPTTPNATHVRVWWSVPLAKDLRFFFDVVKEMKEKHAGSEVRLVFGFDS